MKLPLLLLLTTAALLPAPTAYAQATFTRATTGPIVSDGGYSNMGVWVDYDEDGDLDLFVANGDTGFGGGAEPNCLYRNDGDGTFTKIDSGPLVTDVAASNTGSWGDCDNDGHVDLFVVNNAEGDPSLCRNDFYRNLGDGSFAKITDSTIVQDGGMHSHAAWADYDNDGHLDLVVTGWNDNRLIYHNNRDATYTRVTDGPLATDVSAAQAPAWADYDDDGDLDLFITNSAPPSGGRHNSLYRNDGGGTFTPVTTGSLVAESAAHVGAEWGDYDNDRDLDLFVVVTGGGRPNCLFRNDGGGTFTKIERGLGTLLSAGGNVAAWGDYDNDGFLDLFLSGGFTNIFPDHLFRNNGNGTFTRMTSGVPGTDGGLNLGCAWGDYDNDGFLDLFIANYFGQDDFLYHNDGNANHWLKVRLVGTLSNRAGIGAKVRVRAVLAGTEWWQLREISGGSGYAGQCLLAHFGLRDAGQADAVRIEWPSGIVQELADVLADQTLTVTEPAEVELAIEGAPEGVRVSWPIAAGDMILEQAPALSAEAVWTAVPGVTLAGNRRQVFVPASESAVFFRLRPPQ